MPRVVDRSGSEPMTELAASETFWIDPSAIDPASWVRVPLHEELGAVRGLQRNIQLQTPFPGWNVAFQPPAEVSPHLPDEAAPVRAIPSDRVRRLPRGQARVTRLPRRPAGGYAARRRFFHLAPPAEIVRRGRAAAWGLLVIWLIGTWGTFYGLTGGLKSHENSKALIASSSWGW